MTHFLPCRSTPNISAASKAALPTGEQLLTLTYGDSNSVIIAYRGDQKGYNRGIDKDTCTTQFNKQMALIHISYFSIAVIKHHDQAIYKTLN